MKGIRKCPICGKRFQYNTSLQIYCSPTCARKEKYKRDKVRKQNKPKEKKMKVYPPKKCVICDKEYMPKSTNQVYCSAECHRKARNEKKRKYNKQKEKKICIK